jgi:hypothetical protein
LTCVIDDIEWPDDGGNSADASTGSGVMCPCTARLPSYAVSRGELRQPAQPQGIGTGNRAGRGHRNLGGEQAGFHDITETEFRQPAAEEVAGAEVVQQPSGEGVPRLAPGRPTVSATLVTTAGA